MDINLDGTMLGRKSMIEWQAWKDLVKELKLLGIDINKEDALAEAMRAWAKKFHEYRMDIGK